MPLQFWTDNDLKRCVAVNDKYIFQIDEKQLHCAARILRKSAVSSRPELLASRSFPSGYQARCWLEREAKSFQSNLFSTGT